MNFLHSLFKNAASDLKMCFRDIESRYNAFLNAKDSFQRNLEELVKCTQNSMMFAYQSGSKDYSVFLGHQRSTYDALNEIDSSLNALVSSMFGKSHASKRESNSNGMYSSSSSTFSKAKYAYASVMAGAGTACGIYNELNKNELNKNELKKNELNKTSKKKRDIQNIERPTQRQQYTIDDCSLEQINKVLSAKNTYFWKNNGQIEEIIRTDFKIEVSLDDFVRQAMSLKVEDPNYCIGRINYDSRIADRMMKEDILYSYLYSDDTLSKISYDFERKYGMHVSISTISRYSRKILHDKGWDFSSRKEAKRNLCAIH